MHAIWRFALLVITAAAITGCGQSGDSAAEPNASGAAQAVHQFLEAVRQGDDEKAGQMLTDLARVKTQQEDMVVAPPGSDTASFRIGQMELVDDGTARVASSWTDLDHQGQPRTDQITWTVRRDKGHWRIAGMAAKVFEDRPPIQLNFENPEEMRRQRAEFEKEALQRAESQQRQAKAPEDPFQSGTK